jgi:hypothetical protein
MRTGAHLVAIVLIVLALAVAIVAIDGMFESAARGELDIPERIHGVIITLVPPPRTGVEAADSGVVQPAWPAFILIPLAVVAGAALATAFFNVVAREMGG